MLQKDNLEIYQKLDAFRHEKSRIPVTVLEAMTLTAALGQRYLSVDRLCIVQDDNEPKRHQIRNMSSIYANAYLTVIAGVGDATSPLESSHRTSRREWLRLHEELFSESKWGTLAWTLQEPLFSRRAVFFLKSRVVWQCHCDIWESSKFNPQRLLHGSRTGDPCQNRFMGTTTGF
jgi:hypothetical protein